MSVVQILDAPMPRKWYHFLLGKSYTKEVSLMDVFGKYDPITDEYGLTKRLNELLGRQIILYSLMALNSNICRQ